MIKAIQAESAEAVSAMQRHDAEVQDLRPADGLNRLTEDLRMFIGPFNIEAGATSQATGSAPNRGQGDGSAQGAPQLSAWHA